MLCKCVVHAGASTSPDHRSVAGSHRGVHFSPTVCSLAETRNIPTRLVHTRALCLVGAATVEWHEAGHDYEWRGGTARNLTRASNDFHVALRHAAQQAVLILGTKVGRALLPLREVAPVVAALVLRSGGALSTPKAAPKANTFGATR